MNLYSDVEILNGQEEVAEQSADAPQTIESEVLAIEAEAQNDEEVVNGSPENEPDAVSVEEPVQEEITESSCGVPQDQPSSMPAYHESYYLLFGEKELDAYIAPEKTLGFLTQLKYDGGELKQARKAKNGSALIRDAVNGTGEICSYCGIPIVGVDYYRLSDGRKRCTRCSRSMVKSPDDLNKILSDVLTNMELFFQATIDVPIKVEMLEERKLKKKTRHGIGDPKDKSLILGVAVEKKGEYTVFLENGAPRISVIATLAHELTHIWQYTHWDRKQLIKKYGRSRIVEVYEGMAKWVEIQYLYHIGEKTMGLREEYITRNREDVYGTGFLRYVDLYPLSVKPMVFLTTPFETASDPLSIS